MSTDASPEFLLAGALRIRSGDEVTALRPTRMHEVLALLLLRANTAIPVAQIAASVWPDRTQADDEFVRPYISRLRGLLAGADAKIVVAARRYRLDIDPTRVDVLRFEQLLAQADQSPDPRQQRQLVDAALEACPTPNLLADFTRAWAHTARASHQTTWNAAALRRNRYWLRDGLHEQLLSVLRREGSFRSADPRWAEDYMLALYRSGADVEALGHYAAYRAHQRVAGAHVPERLRQLAAAIRQRDPSLDRPGALTTDTIPDTLPPATAALVGRRDEIQAMRVHATAAGGADVRVIGVYGPPGIGKTALATAYAHAHRSRYVGGALYADLGAFGPAGAVSVDEVLGSFLRALGLRADQVPLERAPRIDRYRDLVRRRRLLVVLDNVARTEDVAALLPTGVGSLAIITSRTRLTALTSRHGALPVVLDRIDHASALALLSRFASVRRGRVPEAIQDIARACDGHPLALCLVGARIATRPEEPVAAVAGALTASTRRIPTLDRYAEAGDTVADVFGWSYASLSREQAYVFRTLGLSVCASLDLPAAASLIGADESAVRPMLRALVDDHLLTTVGPDRYRMLDLLAEYAAALAEDTDPLAERTAALDRLYAHHLDRSRSAVSAIWPTETEPVGPGFSDPAAGRAWLDDHRVDLLAGALHPAGVVRPHHVIDLAALLYRYLDHGGHLDQATQLNDAALSASRALDDQLAAAGALGRVGALLIRLGEAERAEATLFEAEELFAGLGDPRGRAIALGNLGRAAARQGRFAAAAQRQSEALELFRDIGDRPAEARTLTNLGIVLEARGDLEAALEHHEAARVIAEKEGTPDALARALGSIAGVLGAQGRFVEARDRYEDALERFRELGDQIGTATTLTNLGRIGVDQGEPGRAIALHEEALRIFEEVGDRANATETLNNLGLALLASGSPEAARQRHQTALRRSQQSGDRHEAARAHAGLAAVHARWAGSGRAREIDQAGEHAMCAAAMLRELGLPVPVALERILEQVADARFLQGRTAPLVPDC